MKRLLPLLFVLFGYPVFAQKHLRQHLLTELSFETDSSLTDYLSKRGFHYEKCCDYSITLSDSIVRAGEKSIRVELFKSDPWVAGSNRAEIVRKGEEAAERWYGLSIFPPKDFQLDTMPEIVAQWHEIPDVDKGETWRSPPISLMVKSNQWQLALLWDAREVNTDTLGRAHYQGHANIDLGTTATGKWTDWVFHIKFAYDSTGILQIWKNGKLVLNRLNQPNWFNDEHYPYQKLGVYKWVWHNPGSLIDHRVYYYDEIRVGNEKASYKEVAP